MRLTDNDWSGILKRVHFLETSFSAMKSMIEELSQDMQSMKQRFDAVRYNDPTIVNTLKAQTIIDSLEKPVAPEMPPRSQVRIVSESGKEKKVKE